MPLSLTHCHTPHTHTHISVAERSYNSLALSGRRQQQIHKEFWTISKGRHKIFVRLMKMSPLTYENNEIRRGTTHFRVLRHPEHTDHSGHVTSKQSCLSIILLTGNTSHVLVKLSQACVDLPVGLSGCILVVLGQKGPR